MSLETRLANIEKKLPGPKPERALLTVEEVAANLEILLSWAENHPDLTIGGYTVGHRAALVKQLFEHTRCERDGKPLWPPSREGEPLQAEEMIALIGMERNESIINMLYQLAGSQVP